MTLHRLLRPRLVVALCATAVLGMPAAAQAAAEVHRDPAQDVLRIEDESPDTPRVPRQRTADIVKIASVHGTHLVAVTLTLRNVPSADFDFDVHVKTPEAGFFELSYVKYGADEPAQFDLWRVTGDYEEVPCPGKSRRADHTAETIRVAIPRGCLGGPAWVRTGAGSNVSAGPNAGYVDDARRGGVYDRARIALGPRLARG